MLVIFTSLFTKVKPLSGGNTLAWEYRGHGFKPWFKQICSSSDDHLK